MVGTPPVIAGIGSLASDSAREVRNSELAYTRCFQMGSVFITDPLVFAKESTVWEVSAGLPYQVVGSTGRRGRLRSHARGLTVAPELVSDCTLKHLKIRQGLALC